MSRGMNRIWKSLLADRRKASAVVVLLAIGLLLWGRLMLKQVPRTATADPEPEAAMVEGLGEVDPAPLLPVVELPATSGAPSRDLFAFDPSLFIPVEQTDLSGDPAKSASTVSDDTSVERMVHEASKELRLQSTLFGESPRAMVNGRLLELGDEIAGFELVHVGERSAVLEKQGYRIRLEM